MDNQYSIRVENLEKRFGNFTAVDRISFETFKGEIFGFLGANGAGKTTAIRMLCGLLRPSGGKAIVAGYDVVKNPEKVKKNIGYMSQKFSLYDELSIEQNLTFYGGIYGLRSAAIRQKSERLLQKLSLYNDRRMLVKDLPLGWKQKLAFLTASIHDPAIIFLDEPTSGVDPVVRRQFWNMIYEASYHGATIFITTHYMEEAEYCNRISVMSAGKIKALDTPKNLKSRFNTGSVNEVFLKLTR